MATIYFETICPRCRHKDVWQCDSANQWNLPVGAKRKPKREDAPVWLDKWGWQCRECGYQIPRSK